MRRVGRDRGQLGALVVGCVLTLLGHAGCLNPRPEEDPSANVEGLPSGDINPPRESCMSNPALPECAVPVQGGESDMAPQDVDDHDEASDPNVTGGAPAVSPPPPVDAGSTAADTTSDAGVPVEPADAGSP